VANCGWCNKIYAK